MIANKNFFKSKLKATNKQFNYSKTQQNIILIKSIITFFNSVNSFWRLVKVNKLLKQDIILNLIQGTEYL